MKTGKVRFEYRDYAFLGEESTWAAEAAACAGDQGKFWQMHDTIFLNQGAENDGAYSQARLKKMAEAIGLDMEQFNGCFDDRKHQDAIEEMYQEGTAQGVSGTPQLVINGGAPIPFRGYDALKQTIEEELAKS